MPPSVPNDSADLHLLYRRYTDYSSQSSTSGVAIGGIIIVIVTVIGLLCCAVTAKHRKNAAARRQASAQAYQSELPTYTSGQIARSRANTDREQRHGFRLLTGDDGGVASKMAQQPAPAYAPGSGRGDGPVDLPPAYVV